mmetsp:Transcript_25173/g.41418  ORF Transcript_25173/g.41418 Transcript_25173/m.41418 type:complete len:1058 (-) Transcript_25173:144-3317(-)
MDDDVQISDVADENEAQNVPGKRQKVSICGAYRKSVRFSPSSKASIEALVADGRPSVGIRRNIGFSPARVSTPVGKAIGPVAGITGKLEMRKGQNVEPIKVFLRVRPVLDEDGEDSTCVSKITETSVTIKPPVDSQASKNGDNGSCYIFNRVFEDSVPQNIVFEETTLPLVEALFQGESGLCFAYGITNAGKTFTIQGTKDDPGLLPRALEVIFQSINQARASKDGSSSSSSGNDFNGAIRLNPLTDYVVFVSYCEIYNEVIYDLLEEVSNGKGRQRRKLNLKEDATGKVYVDGLGEIPISNAQQGADVLERGQKNRKVAETLLNMDSSRSHSIFNVKLVQKTPRPQDRPSSADANLLRCSRLSFVDLAGSERQKRTKNTGERLQEASSINTSIMYFHRCLDALRYNQAHPGGVKRIPPFRESKLTRLFQDPLSGLGKMVMITNMNPRSSDYDETNTVLKTSGVAKEILPGSVAPMSVRKLQPRPSLLSKKRPPETNPTELEAEESSSEQQPPSMMAMLMEQELWLEIEDLRVKSVMLEAEVRDECATEMERRLRDVEVMYRRRQEEETELQEAKMERKLLILKKQFASERKRLSTASVNDDDHHALIQQIERLEEQLAAKDELLRAEKSELSVMQERARTQWKKEYQVLTTANDDQKEQYAQLKRKYDELLKTKSDESKAGPSSSDEKNRAKTANSELQSKVASLEQQLQMAKDQEKAVKEKMTAEVQAEVRKREQVIRAEMLSIQQHFEHTKNAQVTLLERQVDEARSENERLQAEVARLRERVNEVVTVANFNKAQQDTPGKKGKTTVKHMTTQPILKENVFAFEPIPGPSASAGGGSSSRPTSKDISRCATPSTDRSENDTAMMQDAPPGPSTSMEDITHQLFGGGAGKHGGGRGGGATGAIPASHLADSLTPSKKAGFFQKVRNAIRGGGGSGGPKKQGADGSFQHSPSHYPPSPSPDDSYANTSVSSGENNSSTTDASNIGMESIPEGDQMEANAAGLRKGKRLFSKKDQARLAEDLITSAPPMQFSTSTSSRKKTGATPVARRTRSHFRK